MANETGTDLIRWMIRNLIGIALLAAALFGISGSVAWPMAWAFLGMLLANVLGQILLIAPRNPELLAERTHVRADTKRWDRILAPLAAFGTLFIILIAALDRRIGCSPSVIAPLQWLGAALALGSVALLLWSMTINSFFAATVRIQEERGHRTITTGPYRFVRHPGYSAAVWLYLGIPLMLDSLLAFAPAVLSIVVIVMRTALEDRTLRLELAGYEAYAGRTRFRLCPGIW